MAEEPGTPAGADGVVQAGEPTATSTTPTMNEDQPQTGSPVTPAAATPRRPLAVRIILVAAVVVLVAGVIVAASFGVQSLRRVANAKANLNAAQRLLDTAEENLTTVDEAVRAEITSEIATQSAEAIPLAGKTRADALAASTLIVEALPDLREEQRPLAEAVQDSADARAAMMVEAPVILEADGKAARAMLPADQAVVEIKTAEDLVAKAVASFNKHTKAGVRQSTAYSKEAESHLNAAKSLLATATAEFPEVDFSSFNAYIDAKIGLIAMSKEIDSLWLAGSIEASNKKLDAYNKRDAEVLAMAKALPASVRDPIADAYERLTAEANDRYFEARERARAAGERVADLKEQAETN